MPKPGYRVITISESVFKEAQDYIEKINEEAGYKKIRNVSHFVEQAMIDLAVNEVKRNSEDPEQLLRKVVQIMLERNDLLKIVFKQFLELPSDEAHSKLVKMLNAKEIEGLRKILREEKTK